MFGKLKDNYKRKELDEDKRNIELEKNDLLAMFIAAGSIMFPVLILIFGSIALLVWIIF